jgi:hypothetical protein
MGILNGGPASCAVCGVGSCSCGPPSDFLTVLDFNRSVATMPKDQGPLAVYRTATGDFRLNEADARRRGLLPDGDRLPAAVARRRRVAGGLTVEQVEHVAKRYGKLAAAGRAEALAELALVSDRRLGDTVREGYKVKDADPVGKAEALAGADYTDLERPAVPAPATEDEQAAPAAATLDPAALLGGRVGEVTDYLDRLEPDVAKAAAGELLKAEQAGKGRSTLVAELERRAAAGDE